MLLVGVVFGAVHAVIDLGGEEIADFLGALAVVAAAAGALGGLIDVPAAAVLVEVESLALCDPGKEALVANLGGGLVLGHAGE